MIDVIEKIKPILRFNSPDDFYYLQILQRKKENPHIGSNSRVIKNYYISSIEYLETHYEEIKALCNLFNARAMLRLNRRSYEKTAFMNLQFVANTLQNREYKFIKNSYDRACGVSNNDPNKTWIVDVDTKDVEVIEEIRKAINDTIPTETKVIIELPTKNGVHIITKPFFIEQFIKYKAEKFDPSSIEIHKDNPINLYIP